MPCYDPRYAIRTTFNPETGKFRVMPIGSVRNAGLIIPIHDEILPCGNCTGCRLDRSYKWALRCMHEASQFTYNTFITLTYSPENLPINGVLVKSDFQKFMKRLRKSAIGFEEFTYFNKTEGSFLTSNPIRYYMCGEYGDLLARPHYHALLFNFEFLDKVPYKLHKGKMLYNSPSLSEKWPFGHAVIGEANFDTAAYIAGYISKKINGRGADDYYTKCVDSVTGECIRLPSEYTTMSRKPGIARKWFDENMADVFPSDEVISKGRSVKPPRYYDSIYESLYPDDFALIKAKRKEFALSQKCIDNATKERLIVRERVKLASLVKDGVNLTRNTEFL